MTGGSQQARLLRRALRDGASIADAAAAAGMSIAEARLQQRDDERSPPPPEAYELLGHNNPPKGPTMPDATDDRLRLLIERVERLEEEKKGISDDIKDVYAEARSTGYDVRAMREIVRLRKMSADDRREREMIRDLYLAALGMDFAGTPLGEATIRRIAA